MRRDQQTQQAGFQRQSRLDVLLKNRAAALKSPEAHNQKWSAEDQALIDWVLSYIQARTTTRRIYIGLEKEIALGANSPRASTGELQNGLRLMKRLVEQELARRVETSRK